jgi:hypothetical protein
LSIALSHSLQNATAVTPGHVPRPAVHANFTYQAGSWTKPRRVIAKVEWRPGELYFR